MPEPLQLWLPVIWVALIPFLVWRVGGLIARNGLRSVGYVGFIISGTGIALGSFRDDVTFATERMEYAYLGLTLVLIVSGLIWLSSSKHFMPFKDVP